MARVWGPKRMGLSSVRDDSGGLDGRRRDNLILGDRFGRELGLEDLWVKQCGNSHTGSFKDLGMTAFGFRPAPNGQ